MRALDVGRHRDGIVYPDSDGQPMADNTLQFEWIVVLKQNLDALLADFVGGDLLWYPVEGQPKIRIAPDVLVALGRPKGHRGSYKQWEEEGVAPAVVFEVLSPGNTVPEMLSKLAFYNQHGVDELYVIDPDVEVFQAFVRAGGTLGEVEPLGTFASPRLGIRFERIDRHLVVSDPEGRPFLTFDQIVAERDAVAAERDAVVAERDAVATQLEAAEQRAARLSERLRALGIDPDDL